MMEDIFPDFNCWLQINKIAQIGRNNFEVLHQNQANLHLKWKAGSTMSYDLQHIIEGCINGDATAQRELYDAYKGILFAICRRYLKQIEDAEDVLAESFVKIFTKIDAYTGEGSFEGWMKKITVNEALMFLRKNKIQFRELDIQHDLSAEVPDYDDQMEEEDIMELMDSLPAGYRTVLNLYDVEGYKHREIAELMGISINTSKSQLILARKRMQDMIRKKLNLKN